MIEHCIDCQEPLIDCVDSDPNGERNITCARCRAEQNHDFDVEPNVVFDRCGHMTENTLEMTMSEFTRGMIAAGSILWQQGDIQQAFDVLAAAGAHRYHPDVITSYDVEAVSAYCADKKLKDETWEALHGEVNKTRSGGNCENLRRLNNSFGPNRVLVDPEPLPEPPEPKRSWWSFIMKWLGWDR